jgi:hypothetical protein
MPMRLRLCVLALLVAAPPVLAQSSGPQQCGKGQLPTPNGCMQVCQPGYSIGKDAGGYQSCLRDGNEQVGTHGKKYAFLPIAAGNEIDGICFGIRSDERVETVVDDRFVDRDWHVHPHHSYVAEISYRLDPGLTKLHLTGFRYFRVDANNETAAGDMLTADAVVPLYDAPQADWPCTTQQWATIMTPPEALLRPSPGPGGSGVHIKRLIYVPNGPDCIRHGIGCGYWDFR